MVVITAEVMVNWTSIFFNILEDMSGNQSTGFAVQLSKLFVVLGAFVYAAKYLSRKKMLDAANVLALRPKVSAIPTAAVKNELGEAQASLTKKKPKRKLVL